MASGMLTQTLRPKSFKDLLGNDNNKKILNAILENPDNAPRVMIFGGAFGSGKCVIGNTRVLTNKGYVPIKSLREYAGDMDVEGFAEFKEPIITTGGDASHFYYGGKRAVLTLNAGNVLEITGTQRHRIKVAEQDKDGKFLWKRLDEIKVGDVIISKNTNNVPKIYPKNNLGDEEDFNSGFLLGKEFIEKGCSKRVPEIVYRSKYKFILGFVSYIVESSLKNKDKVLFITESPFVCDSVKDLFNMLGLNPKTKIDNGKYTLIMNRNQYIKLNEIIEYKRPSELLEGRESNHKEIHVNSRLKDIIRSIAPEYMGLKHVIDWTNLKDLEDFFKHCHRYYGYKEYLEELAEYDYYEVLNINIGYEDVYDLTVPGTHEFMGNGFINHNTTSARIMARELNDMSPDEDISTSPYYYELDASIVGNKESIKEYASVFNSTIKDHYKVVVLDEIHAASKPAQTLLLKILEEAPKGIFYILCTTDTDKVIDTIKSRALELHFPTQRFEDIAKYIQKKAKEIGCEIDDKVASVIAYNSSGHMRNAIMELHKYTLVGAEDYLSSSNNTIGIFCELFTKARNGEDYYDTINKLSSFPLIQIKKDLSTFIHQLLKSSVLDTNKVDTRIRALAELIGMDEVKKLISMYLSDWARNIYSSEIDLYTGLMILSSSLTKPKSVASSTTGQRILKANSGVKI